MLQTRLTLAIFLLPFISSAQEKTTNSNQVFAQVNVSVTNTSGKPSKGEQVVFRGEKANKSFYGKTDGSGKFSIDLPAGDDYQISVKSITDSTKYGVISIPALEADQFFTEPFTVNVEFESARMYTLDNVHFDFGKSNLRPGSEVQLDELVSYMKNKETVLIEIAGHTDNVGKPADNLRLSLERAKTIVNYLVKKGIAVNRVKAKGYGDTEPVADNGTDQGRQLNRRTEVRILN